jgi:hypothetical protein
MSNMVCVVAPAIRTSHVSYSANSATRDCEPLSGLYSSRCFFVAVDRAGYDHEISEPRERFEHEVGHLIAAQVFRGVGSREPDQPVQTWG